MPGPRIVRRARRAGLPKVKTDHFAYAALVYVGDTHAEGVEIGSKLLWFLNTSLKMAPQYAQLLPGATPPHFAPQVYRTASRPDAPAEGPAASSRAQSAPADKPVAPAILNVGGLTNMDTAQAMARGILFAGSPDHRLPADHGFLPQGRRLWSSGHDWTVRIHDPCRGREGHQHASPRTCCPG